jgi:hypothetical protein
MRTIRGINRAIQTMTTVKTMKKRRRRRRKKKKKPSNSKGRETEDLLQGQGGIL